MNINDINKLIRNICENYKDDLIGGYITGDGPIPSQIMFIGEAPGKMEVEMKKPFVGMAGKTFEFYLNSIGIDRKNVRITNTCFFRPIKIKKTSKGKESISNRTPKVSEINLFKNILDEEIKLVNPKLIVTLGNIPLKRLTHFKSIGTCHGELYFNKELNRYIFPMYHPSSLTYNNNDKFREMYQNDWIKLKYAIDNLS